MLMNLIDRIMINKQVFLLESCIKSFYKLLKIHTLMHIRMSNINLYLFFYISSKFQIEEKYEQNVHY